MSDINKKRPGTAEAVINFIRKQRTLLLTLSAAVIFITTYVLILPAITLDQQEAERQGGIDLPAAEEQAGEPSAEEQAGDGVLSCEGDGFTVDASFSAKAGLPSDTELAVSEIGEDADDYDAWRDEALAALQDADGGQAVTDLKFARFYDITLASGEEETQPGAPVDVTISYDKALKAEDADHVRIVHFGVDKKGNLKPEVLDAEDVTAVVKKGRLSEASFSAKSFSVYGVVYAEELEAQVLTDSGKTYKVTVTCDEAAEIPEGAELVVKEITEKDEDYQGYYEEAAEAADAKDPGYVRSFDIEIQADGEKIEPKSEVAVNISLSDAPDAEDADLKVIHFGADGPEVMETETNAEKKGGTELNFVTDAFSVYTVVDASGGVNLNGKSYGLVTGIANDPGATTGYGEDWGRDYFTILVNAHAMIDSNYENGIASTGVHAWIDGSQNYVGGDVPQWHFESVGNNQYLIYVVKEGTNYYLNQAYDSREEIEISSNRDWATKFTVTPNNDGTVFIRNGNWYLHNNQYAGANEWSSRNYKMKNNPSNEEKNSAAYRFRLCEKSDDFDSYAAKKVSASTITTNTNYIIYRKFIDEQGGEALYALAHDGSFVRVYDGGDTIYWRETDKNIYWNYQMDGSYPVLFTQDPQTHETIYINPNKSTGQTLSDTANGLTLSGKDNGEYSTAIERWDQKAYDYAGLHVTVDNSGTASLSAGLHTAGTSDEFLFAVASQMPGATAETVDTVDSDSLGIKITMFDYGKAKGSYNAGDKLAGMTNVAGSAEYTPHAAHALVKKYLESGVPSSTSKGAMTGLFALDGSEVTAYKENVNHLFLQSYYDENGTFRYRSEDNYAYLPYNADTETITGTDFTVYRQAATPYTTNLNVGHTYYHHGHFMPFNEIDMNNNLSRLMNQYGNDYQNGQAVGEIPIGDGRTYEDIYGVQGIPNFYTGMMMEANFMQPRGGKLENGDDMIFKFTGDDDMWVYIDDVLVLDIGGIHEPLSGTINFATGKVTNPSGSSLSGTKTLYQIFQDTLNDASTPQTVKDKINAITWKDVNGDGTPDTFADYTNHSFKSFYMERGAGASNLDMQFNLKVIRTDEFTVKKEIPDEVDPRFANQKYKFQATFKDGSVEKPLFAGAKNSSRDTVCTQVTYKDRKDDQGHPVNVEVDENGYFYLKAGEAAVFKMKDDSIQYNVREVDVNTYNLEKITIDGGGSTEHIEINDQQAAVQDNAAAAGMDEVRDRSNVLYTNYPKKQNLEITKHITADSAPIEAGENPVFEFRVYLESTVKNDSGAEVQKLIPYSYGPYYLVKEKEGALHYYTLNGENNTPLDQGTEPVVCSKTGRSGSINSIPPEYTIIIPDLTIGTHFYLEERRDNIPEGYEFVKEELTAGTYDPEDMYSGEATEDVIHRIIARDEQDHQEFDPKTIGRIKSGVDAESHIYNKRPAVNVNVKKAWDPAPEEGTTVKVELHRYAKTTKGSIQVTLLDNREAPIEGAVFELYKKGDGDEFAATGREVTTDVNGKAEVAGLEAGSYKLVQKSTPQGYTMDGCTTETGVLTVRDNVTAAQRLEQTLENTALVTAGKVTLTVTDSGAGSGTSEAPIAGAKFDLYKDGTKLKEGCETNAEGKIIVSGLEAGSYYFEQTAAPEAYKMPTNTRTAGFTVAEAPGVAQNFTQSMTNSLKGKGTVSLTLNKDTGEAISGAEFQLKQGDSVLDTATTGADGTASFNTELYEGQYTVHQVNTGSAGDEYGTAADQTVEIEANSVTTQQKNLTFTNEEAGGNVTIEIWKGDHSQYNQLKVSTFDGLKPGVKYQIRIGAPENNVVNGDHIGYCTTFNPGTAPTGIVELPKSVWTTSGNIRYTTIEFTPAQNDTTYPIGIVSGWGLNNAQVTAEIVNNTANNLNSFSSAAKRFKSALSNLLGASDGADADGDTNDGESNDASGDAGNGNEGGDSGDSGDSGAAATNVSRTDASPAAAPAGYAEDTTFEPIEHVLAAPDWEYTFEGLKEKDANGDPYYYYVVETECSDDSYWIDSYAGDPLYQDGTITVTNKKEKKGNLKVTKEIIGDLEGVTDYNDKNYKVTIKNSAGKFLQSDKTFAATEYEFNVSVSTPLEITDIPVDTYTVTEKTAEGDVAIEHYLWNSEESMTKGTGTVEYQQTATVEIKNYYIEEYTPVPSDTDKTTDLVIDKDWVKADGSTTPADTDTIKFKIKVKSANAYIPVEWNVYDAGRTSKNEARSGIWYVQEGKTVTFDLNRYDDYVASGVGVGKKNTSFAVSCNVPLFSPGGTAEQTFNNKIPIPSNVSTGGLNQRGKTFTRTTTVDEGIIFESQPIWPGSVWVEGMPAAAHQWSIDLSVDDNAYYTSVQDMISNLIDSNATVENLVYTMKGNTLTLDEAQTSCSVRPETATAADWVATLSKLPTYQMIEDKDGNKSYKVYSYEIEEIEVNGKVVKDNRTEDYLVNVTPPTGESTTTQITNTEIKKVNVDAEKKWLNAEGIVAIPENASVSFELYADGKATGKKVTLDGKTRTEEINADDSLSADEKQEAIAALDKEDSGEFTAWKAEWRKLPKYSDDAQTKEITYTVKEVTGYTGYTNLDPDGVSSGGIIRNKEDKLSFDVLKVAKDSKEALSGASFTIQKVKATSSSSDVEYDGDAKAGTPAVTGNDGKLSFTEIAPGYYEVKETKTPDGYVITGGAEFYVKVESTGIKLLKKVVSQGSVTFTEAAQGEKVGNVTLSVDGTTVTFTVENTPGTALPNSGGPGTTWIYLLGAILLLGSGILLAARRRVGKGA